ncbi:MAG: hypothetical protein ACHBN1_31340 [Heteroscytonema crispum UTEX LB 1556]
MGTAHHYLKVHFDWLVGNAYPRFIENGARYQFQLTQDCTIINKGKETGLINRILLSVSRFIFLKKPGLVVVVQDISFNGLSALLQVF